MRCLTRDLFPWQKSGDVADSVVETVDSAIENTVLLMKFSAKSFKSCLTKVKANQRRTADDVQDESWAKGIHLTMFEE